MDFAPAHRGLWLENSARDTSSMTVTPSTEVYSFAGFGRWHSDRPTAPRSPWQNGYCERAIGSIRRECLDHVVVSASGISAICCDLTRPTTTRLARTCPSTRTRRRREQYKPLVALCQRHFWADFIIGMCELISDRHRPKTLRSQEHQKYEPSGDWLGTFRYA